MFCKLTNVGSNFSLTETTVRIKMKPYHEQIFEERVIRVKQAKNYSFMLTLAIMMMGAAFYFVFSGSKEVDYQEIKVANGDSLWSIAKEYKALHNMDDIEFIKWVQDENNLITTKILPGEQLTIPVPDVKQERGLQLADGK